MTTRPALAVLPPLAGIALVAAAALAVSTGRTDTTRAAASPPCGERFAEAMASCVQAVSAAERSCHRVTGAACGEAHPAILEALEEASEATVEACRAASDRRAAGFPSHLERPALATRARSACRHAVSALDARAYGGPHAGSLGAASGGERECLHQTQRLSAEHVARSVRQLSACVDEPGCDPNAVRATIATEARRFSGILSRTCPSLPEQIGKHPAQLASAATLDAECLLATARPAHGPLALACGPRDGVSVPPRGREVRIELDPEVHGTRCGDGSTYAFHVRLAPEGAPLGRIVVQMQGGGVCVDPAECARERDLHPALFRAGDAPMPAGGILDTDPQQNPFAAFTHVYLPYCTRDLFIGGGGLEEADSAEVARFGAVNARAALRHVRDLVWTAMDATQAEGYRPDRVELVFGGTSAGGYGVLYNFHYVVDELGWQRTSGVVDSALALDSGGPGSVQALGATILATDRWNSVGFLPPYCTGPACVTGPVILRAHAARMRDGALPQLLHASNQVDRVQVTTTRFTSDARWLDALRESFCETRDLPGVRYFLSAHERSIHGLLESTERFAGGEMTAAGETPAEWLEEAILRPPPGAPHAVDEGALADALEVSPFVCPTE